MREELIIILQKQIQGELLLPEEQAVVAQWLAISPENETLYAQLKDNNFIKKNLQEYASYGEKQSINMDRLLQLIHQNHIGSAFMNHARSQEESTVKSTISSSGKLKQLSSKTAFTIQRTFSYAAAALVIVAGVYYLNRDDTKNNAIVTDTLTATTDSLQTILTLADGSKIVLDTSNSGILAQQGNTNIEYQNGEVRYKQLSNHATTLIPNADNPNNSANARIAWNELTTPRGKMFHLVLPDGTKAWLNAASSIKFPTSFSSEQREVAIKGEVYFEVANGRNANIESTHTARVPFKVTTKHIQVDVLGTNFNINAYEEEPSVKTTLLNGSVKVSVLNDTNNMAPVILKPSQQATLSVNHITSPLQIATVNTSNEIAWKNGFFHLHKATLKEVMREIQRWYNVSIVLPADLNEGFLITGEFPRTFTLPEVLKALELSGVKAKLENNTIYIESIKQ